MVTYLARSCHGLVVTPICKQDWGAPYPPIVALDPPVVFASPICPTQHQAKLFIDSLLAGDAHAGVVPPSGTCADLYGP